ncbi:hypothetical protein THAOC_03358, partial [Thalassiosira oceanica]
HTGFRSRQQSGIFRTVKQVAAAEVPAPKTSPFRFEFSAEAAEHNTTVLERYDFDLAKVIDDSPGSHNSYGSELRPPWQPWQLEPLLRNHPSWQEFHDDMVYGIQYPERGNQPQVRPEGRHAPARHEADVDRRRERLRGSRSSSFEFTAEAAEHTTRQYRMLAKCEGDKYPKHTVQQSSRTSISDATIPPPASPFNFESTADSAEHNTTILEQIACIIDYLP